MERVLIICGLVLVLALVDLTTAKIAPVGCSSGADCPDNECCVSNDQPRGKRQLLHGLGHCVALGSQGSGCLMMYPLSGKPSSLVYKCPCETGLTCKGTGMFEVPLGETGMCA